eukprot:1180013-Prorocentrum_minimum.AAC.1
MASGMIATMHSCGTMVGRTTEGKGPKAHRQTSHVGIVPSRPLRPSASALSSRGSSVATGVQLALRASHNSGRSRRGQRMVCPAQMFFESFDEYAVKVVKEGMDEAKRLGCKELNATWTIAREDLVDNRDCSVTPPWIVPSGVSFIHGVFSRCQDGSGWLYMQVDTQHLLFGCTTVRDGTSVALEKNKVTKESVRGVLQAMYPQAPAAGLGNMFNMQNKDLGLLGSCMGMHSHLSRTSTHDGHDYAQVTNTKLRTQIESRTTVVKTNMALRIASGGGSAGEYHIPPAGVARSDSSQGSVGRFEGGHDDLTEMTQNDPK